MTSQTYLDTKDKPVNCTSGFATIKYEKDGDGNTVQKHYDTKGNEV